MRTDLRRRPAYDDCQPRTSASRCFLSLTDRGACHAVARCHCNWLMWHNFKGRGCWGGRLILLKGDAQLEDDVWKWRGRATAFSLFAMWCEFFEGIDCCGFLGPYTGALLQQRCLCCTYLCGSAVCMTLYVCAFARVYVSMYWVCLNVGAYMFNSMDIIKLY